MFKIHYHNLTIYEPITAKRMTILLKCSFEKNDGCLFDFSIQVSYLIILVDIDEADKD